MVVTVYAHLFLWVKSDAEISKPHDMLDEWINNSRWRSIGRPYEEGLIGARSTVSRKSNADYVRLVYNTGRRLLLLAAGVRLTHRSKRACRRLHSNIASWGRTGR